MGATDRSPDRIRTLALFGQSGAGKTALAEKLLDAAGVGARGGVLDDAEARERGHGLSMASASLVWDDVHIHLIDTPGNPDVIGDAYPVLAGVDCAAFVVDAVDGVGAQHDELWDACGSRELPRVVVLNGLDQDRAAYQAVVDALRERVGKSLAPVHMPLGVGEEFTGVIDLLHRRVVTRAPDGTRQVGDIGDVPEDRRDQVEHNRQLLVEAIVETDDELLEAYLEGTEPDGDALAAALASGIAERTFFPLLCASMATGIGVRLFGDFIAKELPSPTARNPVAGSTPAGEPAERDVAGPLAACVIKTRVDPYLGRINVLRVLAGELHPDAEAIVARTGARTRLHHLLTLHGSEQQPCPTAVAGDIVAVAKVDDLVTGDTLHDTGAPFVVDVPRAPTGEHRVAVQPATRGDEDKLSAALTRLIDEDPAVHLERPQETGQLVLATAGPGHADLALRRLADRHGVKVEQVPRRIAYRETLRGPSRAMGKLKKQTGGAGQFAIAEIEAEPLPRGEGFVFEDRIVGGVIPKTYIPSVEKGIREAMAEGVLAGYPVVDVQVRLVDGKTHSVDSSQMAFETAGALAFREAAKEAGIDLLEPILRVEVEAPEDQIGDIMGDLSSRRGRIAGTESAGPGRSRVTASVPEAELRTVVPDVRALTHGAGRVTTAFEGYEVVPSHLAQEVVAEAVPA